MAQEACTTTVAQSGYITTVWRLHAPAAHRRTGSGLQRMVDDDQYCIDILIRVLDQIPREEGPKLTALSRSGRAYSSPDVLLRLDHHHRAGRVAQHRTGDGT